MMKARKAGVEILWLDENRYAVAIDGIVCFVGTLEECERRAANLDAKKRACGTEPSARALDPLRMRGLARGAALGPFFSSLEPLVKRRRSFVTP